MQWKVTRKFPKPAELPAAMPKLALSGVFMDKCLHIHPVVKAALDFCDSYLFGLQGLLQRLHGLIRVTVATKKEISSKVAKLGPGMQRNMRLSQCCGRGDAVRAELMDA